MPFLESRQHPIVQGEARTGDACQGAAHDVARGATAAGEEDRESRPAVVEAERPLQRRLVLVDEDAAGHWHAGPGERSGNTRAVVIGLPVDGHGADADDLRRGCQGHPSPARRTRRTTRT